MAVDAQAHPPRFRLWIRRQNVAEGPFSLRFEAMDGKGILRVARPGVLIDPPARPVGLEERLSTQQLRSTRFILVWDGGRARQGHLLNRLEEGQLERLELERWLEMEVVVDGGFRYAVLPVSTPAAEVRPSKPKSRRPSLSELRQALDSITVHGEEPDDVDSALASLTGPSSNSNADVAEAPPPGIAGRRPLPLNLEAIRPPQPAPPPSAPPPRGPPVGRLADFEATRPRRGEPLEERRTQLVDPPLPAPPAAPAARPPSRAPLADAPTVALDPRREALALGEAEGPLDDAEALALGEADDGLDDGAEALLLGAPEPEPTERGPVRASPAPAADAAGASGAAAFFAQFSDAEEEAVFSIDLPSHRQSTEHVTVRRGGGDDESGAFVRDVLPPMRDVLPPLRDEVPATRLALGKARTNHDLEDAVVVLPAADLAPPPAPRAPPPEVLPLEAEAHPEDHADVLPAEALPAEAHPADEDTNPQAEIVRPPVAEPARPPMPGVRPSPVGDHWKNAQTIPPADDGDGPVHRSSTTLVRHLRRKVEEQRARIVELEARIAELEAGRPDAPRA